MQQTIRALGIMNGTSLDAIDYALVESDMELQNLKFLGHEQKPIPARLRARLLKAALNEMPTYELSELHYDLGRLYASHMETVGKNFRFDLIGLHGQTIHHRGQHATLQIGHPAFLGQACKVPVYFDFRAADIVAGGQGAPFAPFFHKLLSTGHDGPMAFHNLGGISNLTYIRHDLVQAFDTGPANILLDAWIKLKKKKDYDPDGINASKGLAHPALVNQFLKYPFFQKKPPKSTGREDFNEAYINKFGGKKFASLSFVDQMATLTELTARSIHQAYQMLPELPTHLFFYGGGTQNSQLMHRLKYYFHNVSIQLTDDIGWPSQGLEASAFATLALSRHLSIPVHLPQVTGATKQVQLGSVYF